MKTYAPIVLFAFTRIDTLRITVEALKKNYLAIESLLYVFVDNAMLEKHLYENNQVKEFIKTITGFQSVNITFNEYNKGLDTNVIDAVTYVLKRHDRCICVEDDVVTTPNFLNYMNQALDFYKEKHSVMSIGAYGYAIKKPNTYLFDAYAYDRGCSWGWATWRDRWEEVDWEMKDVHARLNDRSWHKHFNHSGSDMIMHLKRCINGSNMWDIRFHYHHFNKGRITIYPFYSLAGNIGFGVGATHCTEAISRFKTNMADGKRTVFSFPENTELISSIHRQVYYYNSLRIRVVYKILNQIFKLWKR